MTAQAGVRSAGGWRAWAEMLVAVLLLGLGTFVALQTETMTVVGDDWPGPTFFPRIIAVLFFATGIGVTVRVIRRVLTNEATAEADETTRTDWRTLGIVLAAFLGFIAILDVIGWLLSAAALYWVICTALGARRPLTTLGIALVFSAFIQIAFSLGLGLTLPAGLLGGLL